MLETFRVHMDDRGILLGATLATTVGVADDFRGFP